GGGGGVAESGLGLGSDRKKGVKYDSVELRLMLERSNMVKPATEATVEFEDLDDLDENVNDDGCIQFHPRQYHAVALFGEEGLLRIPASEGLKVAFQIFREGVKVVETSLDHPYGSGGIYFFCVPKFMRTGVYRLKFSASGCSECSPLEFNVQVTAKHATTGATAALRKLLALDYQEAKHRQEEAGMPVLMELPFLCEEVGALKLGLVAFLKALPKGALKEGTSATSSGGDITRGSHNARKNSSSDSVADGAEEPEILQASGWTPALRESWHSHVASAESGQDLMEALLLLESCLDPKWLRPWYKPMQQSMPSTSHLLRLSTPAAVALRLFGLDRAVLYEKVSSAAQRSVRLRSGNQVMLEDVPGQRRTRGSSGSAGGGAGASGRRMTRSVEHAMLAPAPKPKGRQTRTSRAAEGQTTRAPRRRGR
ncbi:unnamed protein product, partial [Choristocarpus tenellus]